ncbi:MAG TPA: helix-turn-helix domain-containing protein [Rhizomicrobium sp.]|jgi:AcrR family transcriptional regulator|nr:helix-turn-helix domain-containing protein [Rhizomicrobium sp.]
MARRAKPATTTRKPAKRAVKKIALETKAKPLQRRSLATYDMILEVTGKLLEEVGVERLSTNLVCQRAKITPPALYRYFPNKYALLKELGHRLMQKQDDAVFAHIEQAHDTFGTVEEEAAKNKQIQDTVNRITREFPGGDWVMRALRAVPTLSAVRIKSREAVAERLFKRMKAAFPKSDAHSLRLAATLSVEVMYASTELVMDQPELDADRITAEISYMVALYRASFADPMRKSHLPVR